MGVLGKIGVIGAVTSFARSGRGQRIIADARRKYDTPANRDKAKQGLQQLRGQVASRRRPGA